MPGPPVQPGTPGPPPGQPGRPSYDTSCPTCGRQMVPVVHSPESAPWACHHCHYSFWVTELTATARAAWIPGYQAWRPEVRYTMEGHIMGEQVAAFGRGHSGLPEHVPLLPTAALVQMHRITRPEATEFRAMLAAAIEARGDADG